MAKAPGFFFYTGDWKKDANLSLCSLSTRGIWIELICSMHENGRSGQLTGTAEQLAQSVRCSTSEFLVGLAELQSTKTAVVQRGKNGQITVTNRRMRRECNARVTTRKRVQDHRVRKKKPDCNGDVTSPSSISSSPSGSEERFKKQNLSPSPAGEGAARPRRERASRFSLDECRKYAESIPEIQAPAAFAKTIWRTGEDDEAIAEFLAHGRETEEEHSARLARSVAQSH